MLRDDTLTAAYLIFVLGQQRYALPVSSVIEVAAMVELVKTTNQRPEVLGVANRHGEVLPMLDLRLVFGHEAAPIDTTTLFIVARHGETQVGLVVDEIRQIEYFAMNPTGRTRPGERFIDDLVTHDESVIQIVALPVLIAEFVSQNVLESSLK